MAAMGKCSAINNVNIVCCLVERRLGAWTVQKCLFLMPDLEASTGVTLYFTPSCCTGAVAVELAVVWSGSHACYVHSGIRILNSFWMLIPRSVISRYSWSQRGRFGRVGATTFGRPPSSIPHPARTLLPIRCIVP